MSSQKYASPLRFKLVPSRVLLSVVLLAHLGAALLLVPLHISTPVKLCLTVLVAISAMISVFNLGWWREGGLLASLIGKKWPRFYHVLWDHDDRWQLTDKQGVIYQARLRPTTLVHRYVVILNLEVSGQPWFSRQRSIILLRDNLDSETLRRLRIRLRWYAPPVADNSAVLK